MSLDLDKLREHYAGMTDDQLLKIVKYEIKDLHPEVIDIVEDEIEHRGLDDRLFDAIDAQERTLTEQDLWKMVEGIEQLPCPECGREGRGLIAAPIRKVRSYILLTQYQARPLIACESCVETARTKALIGNA